VEAISQRSASNSYSMSIRFPGIRAVFFDLDDTLCGYWDAAKKGLNITFEEHPFPGKTTEEVLEVWAAEFAEFGKDMGSSTWYPQYCASGESTRRELMRRLVNALGHDDEDLADRLSHTYYVERAAALELFPEARGVLDELKGRFQLGLITNGPADIQRQEVQVLRIGSYFGPILIEGELKMGKPKPAVFKMAEELVGASGDQILMVGNSYRHDIVPAHAAGWRTAWIRRPSDVPPSSKTGLPEPKPAEGPEPDMTISDLREILPALA